MRRGSGDKATTEPRFLVIGEVSRPHGVHGEVRIIPHTDVPERFTWLKTAYLGREAPQPVEVEGARFHQGVILLKLAGFDSRDAVEPLRGQWLQVLEEDAIPLEEGEYFLYQLEGLRVWSDDGRELGRLAEVIETGANNVFVVRGELGELLLPDIPDVVQAIDFDAGTIIVHLLPGLLGS
jgi:16S rRNA processing protein RimM